MCACVKLIFIIGFCDLVIIIVFLSIQPVEFSSLSMWHLIAQKTLKMSQKKKDKASENAVVQCIDYQIPVTEAKDMSARWRYARRKQAKF